MFVLGYLARCIEQVFKTLEVIDYAEQVKTPNETIETYSATVLSDKEGNITWFRNDNLNLIKKKEEEK